MESLVLTYNAHIATNSTPGQGQSSVGVSVHLAHQLVYQLLPVAVVTALYEMPRLLPVPSTGIAEFERPEEVVCLLEAGPHGDYLVEEVLHADNAVFPEGFLDDSIVSERDTLVLDLTVASLVDELSCSLHRGIPGRESEGGRTSVTFKLKLIQPF